jgi:hypothetical protein
MSQIHPFQDAIDHINAHGGMSRTHHRPYRVLFELAKTQNIDMNGCQAKIGKAFNYSKKK